MLCDLGQITCSANHVTLLQLSRHCMHTLRVDQVAFYSQRKNTGSLREQFILNNVPQTDQVTL